MPVIASRARRFEKNCLVPQRIFILRPDNLGDLVLFSGALRHLRRHWPQAHISLCVKPFGAELFSNCPYINQIVSYDDLRKVLANQGHLPWMPRFRGRDRLGSLIRRLAPDLIRRPYRSDLAILPVVSPVSRYHQLMRQLPTKSRIGVCGSTANQSAEDDLASRPWYSRQWDVSALPRNFSEIAANQLFLKFLGVDMQGQKFSPEFWTTAMDKHQAKVLIPTSPKIITLGLAPGASSISGKNLPSEWFVRSLQGLSGPQLRIVLFGVAADVPICRDVAQALAGLPKVGKVLDFTGLTTVREFIECLNRCDIVFSQETAALHIATALQKPAVGIVGGGHFGRFYPWGDPVRARVVNKPMDCYGCNWHCIYDSLRCLQEIPPEDATKQLQELIDGLQPS